ncbi:SDR family NAD(P)-dependent oxidoreductase [Micromonospora azadirachtae]|uniref:SDR family NAD(P)-dependent oxidoreductase n=1 Tax=Micromonospora azadirachtae TaxID=1970735 RepID=A0ABW2ZWQ5_9ACTN
MRGRVAVITGATRGIGRTTAELLAEAGATVVVTGRDGGRAEEVAKELGGDARGYELDVTDPTSVSTVFKTIAADHGRIDALVANAGVLEDALIGMIRPELISRMLDTNVAGTIATVQAAARVMMRKKSGAVVLLASIVGERGSAGQTAYAASKAAVAAVARSAAKELGPRGIRVNAVAPGLIETDMIKHLPADLLERRVADTALRRLGRAEDVARTIRFLLSDDAAFVTGQVLGVDGGLVL